MTIMLCINLIVLSVLIWKYGWSRVSDFSELKKFFFWAILMLVIGNFLTVLRFDAYNIEYIFSNFVWYFSFWMALKVFEFSDDSIKRLLIKSTVFISFLFIAIQMFLSINGDFWNWDGISLAQEILSVSAFSRFFTVLWMIFSTTLGILIMQLMSEVDKDSEYVNALVMVLIYL
ncbi:MAG: hypothetical protein ABIC57_02740, partial [bacterium]